MTIQQAYEQLIQSEQLSDDTAQHFAIKHLGKLAQQLEENNCLKPRAFSWQNKPYSKGIYLHGRVGRGKTMLMDLFYQHLNVTKKQRIHFHRFMESVHQQLITLSGHDYPLKHIAKSWSENIDVLCFDEFFVNDIADAMLLSGLLDALFNQGVTLVATSNSIPDTLYRNGLQRERFTPTIALLKENCQVISVDGETDHRLAHFLDVKSNNKAHRDYFYPNTQMNNKLMSMFEQLVQRYSLNSAIASNVHTNNVNSDKDDLSGTLLVYGRAIDYLASSSKVIWFDFNALCSGPRSQRDYIYIANQYATVILSDVPQFCGKPVPAVFSGVEDSYQRPGVLMGDLIALDDEARRFIALVDELYDRKIRLIISAAVDIDELYQGKQLSFEFARCRSRLYEMQTITYYE